MADEIIDPKILSRQKLLGMQHHLGYWNYLMVGKTPPAPPANYGELGFDDNSNGACDCASMPAADIFMGASVGPYIATGCKSASDGDTGFFDSAQSVADIGFSNFIWHFSKYNPSNGLGCVDYYYRSDYTKHTNATCIDGDCAGSLYGKYFYSDTIAPPGMCCNYSSVFGPYTTPSSCISAATFAIGHAPLYIWHFFTGNASSGCVDVYWEKN